MQINKLIVIIMVLISIPSISAVEGYGDIVAWVDQQDCVQSFQLGVQGWNITHPNTFDYSFKYYLVYRNSDNIEQTVQLETQTYNKSLLPGAGTIDFYDHFIPGRSLSDWIIEVESGDESSTNKTRYVKIVFDSVLTDDGGTYENHLTTYVDFTGCYAEGTYTDSYEGQYAEIGFDVDSIGGAGGSELLASKIGLGAQDTNSLELGKNFKIMFYAFIPFLFILLWIKMSNKVMK